MTPKHLPVARLAQEPAHPRRGSAPKYPRTLGIGVLLACTVACGGSVDGAPQRAAEEKQNVGGASSAGGMPEPWTGGSGGVSGEQATGGVAGEIVTAGSSGYGASGGGGIGEEWGTGGYAGEVVDAGPDGAAGQGGAAGEGGTPSQNVGGGCGSGFEL
ncbi:MAG: hypothetical protein R3B13_37945 [Polyangiaceae bacterium]